MQDEFVILDLETTGLSKSRHKITEIAAVKIKKGNITDTFESFVNPQVHIPSHITRLTGIDDDMLKDSPTIDKILPEFLNFLGESTLVAHNATFDYGFLEHNVRTTLAKHFPYNALCTKKLARRLLPDLGRYKLSTLCEHFDLVNDQAHRAMSDVKVTFQVFIQMLEMLRERGLHRTEELLSFQSLPIQKVTEKFS